MWGIPTELLQLAGSLIAILALAWIAARMGLGGDPRIRSEEQARALADEAICGFDPVDIAIDRAGYGALLRDAEGRVMLLRPHGAHFASRLLGASTTGNLDRNFLTIETPEKTFGRVTFDLGPSAQEWAASFRRLNG
ncbi:MAG: hypothetical protein IE933_03200 [Sphingomonadales bacterium]|nr:hypothetical protein [Sphingomonadales bacterium]MBD3774231.1 hypothetical protein [Paracoccaceae bacterium]